ncbi:LysM peptidoglycan-binding domain-containing protein [Mucilaginibacter rubeus]|uniref:LysM peptidoglycan-binding domain-containing protein n=1 Tax=Mucilaginibacter rubeus TaxID=2027860 RepID=UPI00166D9AD6|nr:LysM peptidoglycan-binding domain-containing protein [Mucilaginibacter rubeus]GGB14261.1 hypothetical protein GCM10011500_32810 [Mucilaginibacter rubeus]
MSNNKIIKAGQALADIATQYTGTAENVFALAALNRIGITDALKPGATIDAGRVSVFEVASYFATYGISPASSVADVQVLAPAGIEYWIIEYDFIVS